MARILVVDDELSMREFLQILLAKDGHAVVTAGGVDEALTRFREDEPDLVLTDLRMGRQSGVDLLRAVKAESPRVEVVIMTAFATVENAVEAMQQGAFTYILKPFKVEHLRLEVEKALGHRALLAENRVLRHQVGARRASGEGILGNSPAIVEVRKLVEKIAPTRTTVLLTGESGTGKEVVARAIHARGDRADHPFVAINCGAIPEGLIESELFGHVKGSFTGAIGEKAGLFEVAGQGTVFLDEVGELPLPVQVKLLRALQERRARRVGGSADVPFSARVIAATNRDLEAEVRAGRFREDLFYRLNVIQLRLPPLRERREDIPGFLDNFLERTAAELGRAPPPTFSPAALELLVGWRWPGNVRELANVVERVVTLSDGPVIGPETLPPAVRGAEPAGTASVEIANAGYDLQAHLDALERRALEKALERTGGNKTEAARLLALTFRSFRYRLAKYGIGGD